MELDAPERPLAVLEPHHNATATARNDAQLLGHFADDQRVVADGHEGLRQSGKETLLLVLNGAQAAMKELARVVDLAAADVGQGLVAEADAEHRNS